MTLLSKTLVIYEDAKDSMSIEETAAETFKCWETLKYQTGLNLRSIIRRRGLIPFVLFPQSIAASYGENDFPSLFQLLRQAHDAFVFGVPYAALALMRSVMELTLRKHYGATGARLDECIDNVAAQLPKRVNTAALHRLRQMANKVLHRGSDKRLQAKDSNMKLELEIVSLLFVLRDLIEGVPKTSSKQVPHF